MNIKEVKERAKLLGLRPGKMRKTDLIRTIQTTEGNYACFSTGKNNCGQTECCWREDCITH